MPSLVRSARLRRAATAALVGIAALGTLTPAAAAPWSGRFEFAAPAFEQVWAAADAPVDAGQTGRSWTWGPQPWFDYKEQYRESPNGLRQVQYFDKARMEINDPAVAGIAGVTNGLLTVEMVSGRLQLGDTIEMFDNAFGEKAQVPVAGDPARDNPAAPTYASFAGVATTNNGYRDAERSGQRVTAVLDKAGNRTVNEALGTDAATEIVAYNTVTGHNIPRVFADFLATGPVDGLFAFGYPITDPYWIRARVGGQERDVLVQLYERRVVTYTPSNPPAFRVEMGNVGQHYFQWRYPTLGQPWSAGESAPPIAFASNATSPEHWETWILSPDGIPRTQVTSGEQETVPYSWRRTYAGGAPFRLITDSRRDGGMRRLFSINLDDFGDVQPLTQNTTPSANDFNAAVSPDGTQLAFATYSDYVHGLTLMPLGAGFPSLLTAPGETSCVYESPTWLPDGSGLVFATNCPIVPRATGDMAVYRADLRYIWMGGYLRAELANYRTVAAASAGDRFDARYPRVSPDGSQVVFTARGDLYTVGIDGGAWRQITTDPADDSSASWSPDGMELAFDSSRDGDWELYRVPLDDLSRVTRLTDNTADDRWPLWAQ